jgi:hypothetical protein
MEVIELIGCDVQDAVLLQCRSDCIQKIVRENPALLMPPLRPRIGKQKVKSFDRIFRQQMSHREQSVSSNHSQVIDLLCFASNFLHPLGKALNPEEVFVRELLRQITQKRSIAAAKIDL